MSTLKERVQEYSRRPIPLIAPVAPVEPPPLNLINWGYQRYAARLWDEAEGNCFYCGRFTDPCARQVDHVVPQIQRGFDAYWNLVAACKSCNASKGRSLASDWCTRWLLFRLMQSGVPREQAIERRNHIRDLVSSTEAYHFYLIDLAKEGTTP